MQNLGKCITDADRHVAKRLKIARLQSGLSQEKAAETLGLTFQQLQKYEKGVNRISAGKLSVLAGVYAVSIGWFFEGLNEERAPEQDIAEEFMVAPLGIDLARHYLKIHNDDRSLVVQLAAAFAQPRAA